MRTSCGLLVGAGVVRIGPAPSWLVGIDSGGTRSRLVARRLDDGHTIEATGSGSTPDDIGVPQSARNLVDLVCGALPDDTESIALAIGIGGLTLNELRAELQAVERFSTLVITSDVIAAWAATDRCGPAIGLIAGTGSNSLGVGPEGHVHRSGGWGPVVGDEGSAYELAIAAVRAVLQGKDGRRSASPALEAAIESAGGLPVELIAERSARSDFSRKDLAHLARGVTAAAEQGDETALQLLARTATGLADHVRAVARAIELDAPVVGLVGGLFAGGQQVRSLVDDAIVTAVPGSRLRFLEDFDAARGVLQLGATLLGVSVAGENAI